MDWQGERLKLTRWWLCGTSEVFASRTQRSQPSNGFGGRWGGNDFTGLRFVPAHLMGHGRARAPRTRSVRG